MSDKNSALLTLSCVLLRKLAQSSVVRVQEIEIGTDGIFFALNEKPEGE